MVNPFKKKKIDNFRFALGSRSNFIDLDRGCIYMLQEYAEAMNDPSIPEDKKPKKIKVMNFEQTKVIEELDPYIIEERMKDPKPDPRY